MHHRPATIPWTSPRRHEESLHDSPRADPARYPPGALRVLRLQARQLHARIRAVDECLFTDVHPHVGDAPTGLGREQQDITGPQRVEHGSHFAAGARLIATHPREADAVLAVGPLDEARAIKPVFRGPAPDVRNPERVERGLHDAGGIADDHEWWLGGRERRWLPTLRSWPAAVHRPANG